MFVIDIPYFNLEQTSMSGQDLRWIKVRSGTFLITQGKYHNLVEQRKDTFYMSCSEQEFFDIWFKYFDLETDYSVLNSAISSADKDFRKLAEKAKGVRIIRKSKEELGLISICRSNDFPYCVFCMQNGKLHKATLKPPWYEMPSAEHILEDKYDMLESAGFTGELYEDIQAYAEYISDGWLEALESFEDLESFNKKQLKFVDVYSNMLNIFMYNRDSEKAIDHLFGSTLPEFKQWYLDPLESNSELHRLLLTHYIISMSNMEKSKERKKKYISENIKLKI